MTIFICENSLDGIMSGIYDAWASGLGYRNVRLTAGPVVQAELFCKYCHADTDPQKTSKVSRSICRKISVEAWRMTYHCALSSNPERADVIYRFLLYGFSYGSRALQMFQEAAVSSFFELDRKVKNEAHHYKEFIRFSSFPGDVLISHISPRSDVLTLTAPYFADRLPSEHWIIIDDTRHTAAVHPKEEDFYTTHLSAEEVFHLSVPGQKEDPYPDLWKCFFRSVSIEARENSRCQRGFLPLWLRKHMTEFETETGTNTSARK